MVVSSLLSEIVGLMSVRFGEKANCLRSPASEVDIKELSDLLGRSLPNDFLEWVRLHDGEEWSGGRGLFSSEPLFSLPEIINEYRDIVADTERQGGLDNPELHLGDDFRMVASGPVWPYQWSRGWVPFWNFYGIWAIDLSPPQGGSVGQIISVHWEHSRVFVEFESFSDMLASYRDVLRRGERDFNHTLKVRYEDR